MSPQLQANKLQKKKPLCSKRKCIFNHLIPNRTRSRKVLQKTPFPRLGAYPASRIANTRQGENTRGVIALPSILRLTAPFVSSTNR